MTMSRSYFPTRFVLFGCLCIVITGCDAIGTLFQSGVTVVVENATGFNAVPDIETADSRNLAEDLFAAPQEVSSAGTIPPNQTATLRFDCDGALELISFHGARFQDAGGFGFGDADANESWRRDVDFDCGDTIRIRLTGSVFFFDVSTSVERRSSTGIGGDHSTSGDDNDDIGSLIDQLLGS